MKKTNNNSITARRIASRKLVLYAAAGCALFADFAAILFLALSGVTAAEWLVCPCLLFVLDVGYLVYAAFSNYRFRYALVGTFLYIGCAFAFTVAAAIVASEAGGVITGTAGAFWLVLHILSLLTVAVCTFDAANLGKKLRCAAIELAVLTALAAAGYFVFSLLFGAFGQGLQIGNRTLRYRYDEGEKGYTVTGLVQGRGDTLVVPETFNGKPVLAVDCSVFTAEGVREVYLNCAADLRLDNTESLSKLNKNTAVYVDRSEFDALRGRYFGEAYETRSEALLRFACSFAPVGLDEDEAFVTFDYSMDTLVLAKGVVMPVWIFQKGTAFGVDFCADTVDYAAHASPSDENLDWSYNHYNGYILGTPTRRGASLAGEEIRENILGASVNFEKIYRVTLGDDNDERYETDSSYKQTKLAQKTLPYRYVTKSTANAYLSGLPARKGFTCGYTYASGTAFALPFQELSFVLEGLTDPSSVVTVYPEWELNEPVVSVSCNVAGGVRYYDPFTLTVHTDLPVEGIACTYGWNRTGEIAENEFRVAHMQPDDVGDYTVTVTVGNDKITSLTASVTRTYHISMIKRTLTLDWSKLDDPVYDATDKSITATCRQSEVVANDEITFTQSAYSVHDAKSYSVTATLDGDCENKYRLSNPTQNYMVTPRPLTAEWSDTAFTYDGETHLPTATAVPLEGDSLNITVTGVQRAAGSYTATASTGNTNYVFTSNSSSVSWTIEKREITLVWGNTAFDYNGAAQQPAVTGTTGAVAGEESALLASLTISGAKKDAGDYTATASLPAVTNYKIAANANTTKFNIQPVPLTVTVNDASKIYDGKPYSGFTARAQGLKGSDTLAGVVTLSYTGAGTTAVDAGDHAVNVTATLKTNNYTVTTNCATLKITPRSLTVKVNNADKTYDGLPYSGFTVSTEGLVSGEELSSVATVTFTGTGTTAANAGSYPVSANVALKTENYTLAPVKGGQVTISPKAVALVWSGKTTYEEGEAVALTASGEGLTFTYAYYDGAGNKLTSAPTAAGNYTVVASVSGENYMLTNTVCAFTIKEAEVEHDLPNV